MKYISIPEDDFKKLEEDASKYNLNVKKHEYFVSLKIEYLKETDWYTVHESVYAEKSGREMEWLFRSKTWSIFNKLAERLNEYRTDQKEELHLIKEELKEIKKKWWYNLFS